MAPDVWVAMQARHACPGPGSAEPQTGQRSSVPAGVDTTQLYARRVEPGAKPEHHVYFLGRSNSIVLIPQTRYLFEDGMEDMKRAWKRLLGSPSVTTGEMAVVFATSSSTMGK